jgi:hypothetical protein
MATNIRTYQIFRMDPELVGNISIFHCFPRSAFELQDKISGEELETRSKNKAISANTVNGFYEQKLGIVLTAEDFIDQLFNFWQLTCFMFTDESLVAGDMKKIYESSQTSKEGNPKRR